MRTAPSQPRFSAVRELPGWARRSAALRQVAREIVPHVVQLETAVVRATIARRSGACAKGHPVAFQLVLDGARIDPREMATLRHRVAHVARDGRASVPRPDGPGAAVDPSDRVVAEWAPQLTAQLEAQCEELELLGRLVQAVPLARVQQAASHRLVGAVYTVPHQVALPGRPLDLALAWVPTFFGLHASPLFDGVGGQLSHIGARPLESLGFGALVLWRALAEPEVVTAERVNINDLALLPHTLEAAEDGAVRLRGVPRQRTTLPSG